MLLVAMHWKMLFLDRDTGTMFKLWWQDPGGIFGSSWGDGHIPGDTGVEVFVFHWGRTRLGARGDG